MKFVFLDIDGVVNSSRSVIVKLGPTIETSEPVRELARLDEADTGGLLDYGVEFGLKTVDPVCVALVNKVLTQDDIGLVLSSTHRKFLCHSKVPFGGVEHLRRHRLYLTAMGLHVPPFLSVTPVLHTRRGEEVEAWLNNAYEEGFFCDNDAYVILDDSADFLPGQPLVLVDATHGYSFADYGATCTHLGLKEPGLVLL